MRVFPSKNVWNAGNTSFARLTVNSVLQSGLNIVKNVLHKQSTSNVLFLRYILHLLPLLLSCHYLRGMMSIIAVVKGGLAFKLSAGTRGLIHVKLIKILAVV